MTFSTTVLAEKRPANIRSVVLPRRQQYFPSPLDWRDQVIYFLFPDRFSDGHEANRPLLERTQVAAARPAGWRWEKWAQSGSDRWQGGTLKGITSKLDYLKNLGITTVWVGPIFKQRGHLDTYYGYAIQDFLDVEPRFGTREDLVELVSAAHSRSIRVLLDIVINHSAHNWDYKAGDSHPYKPWPEFYEKGLWLDANGNTTASITSDDDGVWPTELQPDDCYTRAGSGSLSGDDVDNDRAEFKRSDFPGDMRDFSFDGSNLLNDLARCYKYWIALTDCDGFRIDAIKNVPEQAARKFCGTIKEFAANLGKVNFFLVGEVAGAQSSADRYLNVLGLNLNATLDIGPVRPLLSAVAKGLVKPTNYFDIVEQWDTILGSHRNCGSRHVSILDDHDHVNGEKIRFSTDASSDHQVVAGVAIQLFTLGIPCIYYGTEQAFAGSEKSERDKYLPDYGTADKFLREAMFGSEHPRAQGRNSLPAPAGIGEVDNDLPGFGSFGSVGHHCFDQQHPAYMRIAALLKIRREFPVLRYGRQYLRDISNFNAPFAASEAGEIIAWSRILDEEEALCIVNGNGLAARGGDVVVEAQLNGAPGAKFQVVANSAQAAAAAVGEAYTGVHPVGSALDVRFSNNTAFVELRDLPPSEVLVLSNLP